MLFFLVLAGAGGDAGQQALELAGEAGFGALIGIVLGIVGGVSIASSRVVTARYEGIYALGFGLAAFGLADVSFGNGLIAAYVAGITLGFSEHEITERFADFSENLSTIFQVLTFFVFGAVIVATGYDASIGALVLLFSLPCSSRARSRSRSPSSAPASRACRRRSSPGSDPRGSHHAACDPVLDAELDNGTLVFDVAAFVILASIVAHGLTDTVGARWIERRMADD